MPHPPATGAIDMGQIHKIYRPEFQMAVERGRRFWRSLRETDDISRRRELSRTLPRDPALNELLDPVEGFGSLPASGMPHLREAIEFAQTAREESRGA